MESLKSHRYFEIAKEIKDNILAPSHPMYYFGISDSWSVWQSYMTLMRVDSDVISRSPLLEYNLKNVKSWFFLSGSDDCAWAGLGLLSLFNESKNPKYLYMSPKWYGAKGSKQLWEKSLVYVADDGSLFWNADRSYQPTISSTLWMLWSLKMYSATKEEFYMQHALKTYHWIMSNKLVVNGMVFDGFDGSSFRI